MSKPLCINCKHFQVPDGLGMPVSRWAQCTRFRLNPDPNPVDGSPGATRFCITVREDKLACGPDGVGFEPATVEAAA